VDRRSRAPQVLGPRHLDVERIAGNERHRNIEPFQGGGFIREFFPAVEQVLERTKELATKRLRRLRQPEARAVERPRHPPRRAFLLHRVVHRHGQQGAADIMRALDQPFRGFQGGKGPRRIMNQRDVDFGIELAKPPGDRILPPNSAFRRAEFDLREPLARFDQRFGNFGRPSRCRQHQDENPRAKAGQPFQRLGEQRLAVQRLKLLGARASKPRTSPRGRKNDLHIMTHRIHGPMMPTKGAKIDGNSTRSGNQEPSAVCIS